MYLDHSEIDFNNVELENTAIDELDAKIGYFADWAGVALETITLIHGTNRDEHNALAFIHAALKNVDNVQKIGAWFTARDITVITPFSVIDSRHLLLRTVLYLQFVESYTDDSAYYDADEIRVQAAEATENVVQALAIIDATENNDAYFLRLIRECRDMVDSW